MKVSARVRPRHDAKRALLKDFWARAPAGPSWARTPLGAAPLVRRPMDASPGRLSRTGTQDEATAQGPPELLCPLVRSDAPPARPPRRASELAARHARVSAPWFLPDRQGHIVTTTEGIGIWRVCFHLVRVRPSAAPRAEPKTPLKGNRTPLIARSLSRRNPPAIASTYFTLVYYSTYGALRLPRKDN